MRPPNPIYHEEVRLGRWRIWAVLGLVLLLLGMAWMKEGATFTLSSEQGSLIMGASLLLAVLGAAYSYYVWSAKLVISIDDHEITYQLRPWQPSERRIDWREVADADVVETSPSGQMSGWGVQTALLFPSSCMTGRNGLSLTLQSGERVFIGSKQPQRLQQVLSHSLPAVMGQQSQQG